MLELIRQPWPWYVAGPLIGLFVPLLLLFGRAFGISSSLRHLCALVPGAKNIEYFRYDLKSRGVWNLLFVLGVVIGGFIAANFLSEPGDIRIAEKTKATLAGMGIGGQGGLAPREIFRLENLATLNGFLFMIVGGFLVGFGTRWADGCTSGHGITGMSTFQKASVVALIGFFLGGLLISHVAYPVLLK